MTNPPGNPVPFRRQPPRLPTIHGTAAPYVYFVTFCTMYRRRCLATPSVHDALIGYAEHGFQEHSVGVGRYVLMPDHVHLFVCGGPELNLGIWVRGLKRALSGALPAEIRTVGVWQPGFFDHLLRNHESYAEKWDYVRRNPVRAGLAERAEDWPFQGEVVAIAMP